MNLVDYWEDALDWTPRGDKHSMYGYRCEMCTGLEPIFKKRKNHHVWAMVKNGRPGYAPIPNLVQEILFQSFTWELNPLELQRQIDLIYGILLGIGNLSFTECGKVLEVQPTVEKPPELVRSCKQLEFITLGICKSGEIIPWVSPLPSSDVIASDTTSSAPVVQDGAVQIVEDISSDVSSPVSQDDSSSNASNQVFDAEAAAMVAAIKAEEFFSYSSDLVKTSFDYIQTRRVNPRPIQRSAF